MTKSKVAGSFSAENEGNIRQLFDDRGCVPPTQAEALGAN